MSSANLVYVGIDLGTTNSTAAVFDGDKVTLVRNSQGSPITPSVVRIDARGNLIVGARARRFLESDPDNTRAEFKRLMGTAQAIRFAAAGVDRRPEELAAEVLKSLRKDIEDQLGFVPARAVISVPALFELPQSSATSEAARLAGFERVELLQEPIASALAAGWTIEDKAGSWLVYDLGGGTFDVSLLETRDGLLRVIGHDGDNFLGGRDFDWAIVDWILEQLARKDGVTLSRAEPGHAATIRKIKLAAEEAKIELSRVAETSIAVAGLSVGGADFDLDLVLDRDTLERLCAPAIERSLVVCRRLLAAHGVPEGGLTRVVMVGGRSARPRARRRPPRRGRSTGCPRGRPRGSGGPRSAPRCSRARARPGDRPRAASGPTTSPGTAARSSPHAPARARSAGPRAPRSRRRSPPPGRPASSDPGPPRAAGRAPR